MDTNEGPRELFSVLWDLFPRLIHMIMHDINSEAMRKAQLNPTQSRILLILYRHEQMRMSDLCLKTNLQKSSMTSVVDTLCESGLLERVRDPHDRRSIMTVLTPEGIEVAKDLRREVIQRFTRRTDCLSKQEKEELAENLKGLEKLLGKMEGIHGQEHR